MEEQREKSINGRFFTRHFELELKAQTERKGRVIRMGRRYSRWEQIAKWLVFVPFTVIILFLTLQSVFSTAYIAASEKTYYAEDKPIRHFLVLLVLLLGIMMLKKAFKKNRKKEFYDKIGMFLIFGCSVLFSYIIVMNTQLAPRSDQRLVLLAVAQLREGDFSSMDPGGYLALWPHQMGTVLYHYYLSFFLGANNYLNIQIYNVFMLGIFQVICFYMAKKMFPKASRMALMLGIVSFVPLTFYVSFVYGNIAGLTFSTLAIFLMMLYQKSGKVLYAIGSFVTLWMAILIKGNYLIFLIAMLIFLLIDYLSTWDKKSLFFIVLFASCYLLYSVFVHQATKQITGRDVPKGVPAIAWVAMGMQEGYAAKGWFNTYVGDIYEECDQDTAKISKKAKEDIKASLEQFKNDKEYARQFWGEKVSSQWNNPTFQCFWIYYDRTSEIAVPAWMKDMVTGNLRNKLISLFNVIQTQILFGVCLFILYRARKCDFCELLLALCFVGGFLFHLLWEAKCQYTVTYFVLLIPYAIEGFRVFAKEFSEKNASLLHSRAGIGEKLLLFASNKTTYILFGLLLVLMLGTIYQATWFTDTIKITKDQDRFQEKVTPVEVEY